MKKYKRIDLSFCCLTLRKKLLFLKRKYSVKSLYIFGSVARGDNKFDSDIDLLVEFSKTPSLLKIVNMENYISDLLQIKVDLVIEGSLRPVFHQRVMKELIKI